MIKKMILVILLIAILLFAARCSSIDPAAVPDPPVNEIGHLFGGPDNDQGRGFFPSGDGGYWILGNTESYGSGGTDVWLIRTDSAMRELWSATFGGPEEESVQSGFPLPSGEALVICGDSGDVSGETGHIFLKKISGSGEEIWSREYRGTLRTAGGYVNAVSDGGFIIAGSKYISSDRAHFWLIRTDPNGQVEWERTYGGTGSCYPNSVSQTPDGGFLLYGEGAWDGDHDYSVWQGIMVKTDGKGREIWHNSFGGPQSEEGYGSLAAADGGYIAVGFTNSNGFTGGYILKTDPQGSLVWFRQLPDIFPFRIYPSPEGGYVMSGFSSGSVGFMKTDSQGNTEWFKSHGRPGLTVHAFSFFRTGEGNLLASGTAEGGNTSNRDIFALIVDSGGNVL